MKEIKQLSEEELIEKQLIEAFEDWIDEDFINDVNHFLQKASDPNKNKEKLFLNLKSFFQKCFFAGCNWMGDEYLSKINHLNDELLKLDKMFDEQKEEE